MALAACGNTDATEPETDPEVAESAQTKQARAATVRILKLFGFEKATIRVGDRGRAVTIAMPRKLACTAQPGDERRIAARIGAENPRLAGRVSVRVARADRSLTSYVAARCRPVRIPAGPGQLVYKKNFEFGPRTLPGVSRTRPIHIGSQRWAIEYHNRGRTLSIFVYEDEILRRNDRIVVRGRGVGRKTFRGPGNFRLAINGSGGWTLRVRDG